MRSVGELVFRMHSECFVHRDLHDGNILIGEKGPVLIGSGSEVGSRASQLA